MPLKMCTLASSLDVPETAPESVLTGSGIAASETAAVRVPRVKRMRLRFIDAPWQTNRFYFFGSATAIPKVRRPARM
jgi:hypothetical protein